MCSVFISVENIAHECHASRAEQIVFFGLFNAWTELFDNVADAFFSGHFTALYQRIITIYVHTNTSVIPYANKVQRLTGWNAIGLTDLKWFGRTENDLNIAQ